MRQRPWSSIRPAYRAILITLIAATTAGAAFWLSPRIRQAELKGHHLEGLESDRTRSDLESLFLDLIRPHRSRIPPPAVNVKLGRWTVDFLWRSKRLVVEVDSFTYHRGSVAFHADHERDLDLRDAGYNVLRFDELHLENESERVIQDLERELGQRSGSR